MLINFPIRKKPKKDKQTGRLNRQAMEKRIRISRVPEIKIKTKDRKPGNKKEYEK